MLSALIFKDLQIEKLGTPAGIRTPGLRIMSPVL